MGLNFEKADFALAKKKTILKKKLRTNFIKRLLMQLELKRRLLPTIRKI